jgi:predicted O-methyltransferase YrrM
MEPTQLTFLTARENRTWQGIRGWLLPSAAEVLYRYASQANPEGAAVEIGSFAGKSTVCIARALKDNRHETSQGFAIDIHFQPDFRDNLNDFGVLELIHCLERSSLDAAETWTQPISFLYIDGHHGKAHAYADLVVWDTMVMPGGIVALDDTIGFMIGPNLQLQAAMMTGAYELLTEVGGVSFLKKKKAILPFISDFPLSKGSLIAYVHYIGAWLGAMDPAFRLPQRPQSQAPESRIRGMTLKEPQRILEWLEMEHYPDEMTANTLSYLSACLAIRLSRVDSAIEKLRILCELDRSLQFLHYKIGIREMVMLRLAQAYDLQGARNLAKEGYVNLIQESATPEIRRHAELGLSTPFRLPDLSRKLLLREYNLELAKYRATLPLT